MKTLKKKLAVVLSLVMAICMLAPMAAVTADAEDAAKAVVSSVKFVEAEDGSLAIMAEVTSAGAVTAEVKVGTKTKKEDLTLEKGTDVKVELTTDYLKSGKKATIKIGTQTLTVNAKGKTKAVFDGVNKTFDVTLDGKKVASPESIMVKEKDDEKATNLYGADGKVVYDFEKYYKEKTAKYEVYVVGNLSEDGKTYTPDSKVAKVSVAKQKKAPKITVDPNTFTFKVPAKHEYVFVPADSDGDEVTGAAVKKAEKVNILDIVSNAGVSIEKADYDKEATCAGIVYVNKVAAGKVVESAKAEVVIYLQEAASEGAITYTYKLSGNKQKAVGVIVENTSTEDIYEIAVNEKGEVFTDKALAATGKDKVKWMAVRPGAKKTLAAKKAASGSAIVYRVKAVKAKKDTPYAFASTMESVVIGAYPTAPTADVKVTFAKKADKGALTASGTAVTAVAPEKYEDVTFVYTVGKKNVKAVAIGAKATDEKINATEVFTSGNKIEVKAGQFVTVYALDKDGKVLAFGCKKVVKTDIF